MITVDLLEGPPQGLGRFAGSPAARDHVGAGRGKRERHRPSDAATAAGDECMPAVQIDVHGYPSLSAGVAASVRARAREPLEDLTVPPPPALHRGRKCWGHRSAGARSRRLRHDPEGDVVSNPATPPIRTALV